MVPLAALAVADLVVLGICVVLAIRGAIRGLTWQLIRTAGLVGAIWLAGFLNEGVGDWINDRFDEYVPDGTQYVIGWCVVFGLAWLVVTFVAYMGRGAVKTANLSGVDRIFGLALGAVMGIVLATAIFVGYGRVVTENKLVETLDESISARFMAHVIDAALPLVPEPIKTDWTRTFEAIQEAGDED